ncbi:cytochrome C4 [Kiloniella laminariae]|uniref:Cytochrome C4 n=1 Tax=Kiloniella laminariae TaxID=454162 RepID=A0ABT4LEQ6_9PROT|nr:c-type cytochrome [Kiloniella laminariae]MCZ4279575.1 cytochrome C4 [Kiloniella laminariae]
MMKQLNLSLATSMVAAVLAGSVAPSVAVADDPQNTPIPAFGSQCLSCHGEDGRPELADVPIIAGQQPIYLANALRHYKSGERTGGQALVMQEMVKNLSDEQIVALSQWFGAQQ